MDPTPAPGENPLRVAVTGSSGLIGTALVEALAREGHEVRRVVRRMPGSGSRDVFWKPSEGRIDAGGLEGLDAVVHLAGDNVGERWTPEKKRRIRDSRVLGTRLLAETLASLQRPPRVLVSAAAVGYYGDRGDERLDEQSPPGDDFLARVGVEWEEAAEPAQRAGIRVVRLRLGVVLSRNGGALARLLLPFRLGLGGRIGSGGQWMSWISLADAVDAIRFAITTTGVEGPVNAVAPEPVTNEEFTRALGEVLGRPTVIPVPAPALRLVFGEMADATLLASQRAIPDRLLAAGFVFRHPRVEDALRAAL